MLLHTLFNPSKILKRFVISSFIWKINEAQWVRVTSSLVLPCIPNPGDQRALPQQVPVRMANTSRCPCTAWSEPFSSLPSAEVACGRFEPPKFIPLHKPAALTLGNTGLSRFPLTPQVSRPPLVSFLSLETPACARLFYKVNHTAPWPRPIGFSLD